MAYDARGVAYARKGGLDQAISDFSEAIRLNPKLAKGYSDRASAYLLKNDPDRAPAKRSTLLPNLPLHI
jgi:tetratricopeptide (TPR) repeat protein